MDSSSTHPPRTPSVPAWTQNAMFRRASVLSLFGTGVLASSLVPIPYVDRFLKRTVQRGCVRALAHLHGAELSPAAVADFADDHTNDTVSFAAKNLYSAIGVVARRAGRSVAWLLTLKRVAPVMGEFVTRGYLLDVAMEAGACGPDGAPPDVIRQAIDRTGNRVGTDPLERVVRFVQQRYRALAGDAAQEAEVRLLQAFEEELALQGVHLPIQRAASTESAPESGPRSVDHDSVAVGA